MPEASARKLPDSRADASADQRVRLRVVDGPAGSASLASATDVDPADPAEYHPARADRPAPGRPHPRSRIRPDLDAPAPVALRAVPEAPTVTITGRTAPRPVSRHRTAASGPRPDRLARWAVVLGIFMAFMAAATARADQPGAPAASGPGHVAAR